MPTARTDTGPFSLIPEWVLDAPISDRAVRLYGVLARYADRDDGTCFPSRTTLANRIGCSLNSLDRARQELLDVGAVTSQVRRREDGGLTSNLFTVHRVPPTGRPLPADGGTPLPERGEDNESHLELEPSNSDAHASLAEKRSRKRTTRDDLWDVIAGRFGDPQTPTERTRLGKVVTELASVSATPDQVRAALAEMDRRGWNDPSPLALTANWSSLTGGAARRASPPDATDPGGLAP